MGSCTHITGPCVDGTQAGRRCRAAAIANDRCPEHHPPVDVQWRYPGKVAWQEWSQRTPMSTVVYWFKDDDVVRRLLAGQVVNGNMAGRLTEWRLKPDA